MRMVEIISKKQEGVELSTEEINFLIKGFTLGDVPEYQFSAWAMAVYFKDMSTRELSDLTMAMVDSGDKYVFEEIEEIIVDKHSTGGVGDTTTIVLIPLVAAAGLVVAKMSGRSLGHAGGTIDKLESIPNFLVEQSEEKFINQIKEYGMGIISQSKKLTPADKKIYSLRDMTSTVKSIPLIASSVMCKKIASGADKIVLDVKVGNGAFVQSFEEAINLAERMVEIGESLNRETVALISNMNEPLGNAIGNSLEIKEAVITLQGNGPKDLEELCLKIGSYMLVLGKKAQTLEDARGKLEKVLKNGDALKKFEELILLQGGDAKFIHELNILPQAKYIKQVRSTTTGFINKISAEDIGKSSMLLGAGRVSKDSKIDHSSGILMKKKVGHEVNVGDILAELHYTNLSMMEIDSIKEIVINAFEISYTKAPHEDLIKKVISKRSIQ